MPRSPRLDFPGAVHHVIVKGNDGSFIFRDDEDREVYLRLLNRYHDRFRFRVLSYCLMGTHAHLAIESGDTPLSRVMQAWQTAYAQRFNRRHAREGHLFRGRYKALLVQVDRYLLALVRYIHRNPVEAGLCFGPERYSWSSDRYYRGEPSPNWLDTTLVLSTLGSEARSARRGYSSLMGERTQPEYGDLPVWGQVLKGDESFARELFRREKRPDLVRAGVQLDGVARAVAAATQIPVAVLRGPGRSRSLTSARGLLAHVAKRYGTVPFSKSARFLSRGESSVVRLAGRFERGLLDSAELRERLEVVLSRL